MDIINHQVKTSYDESAMEFIVNAYIREKIDPSVFIDQTYAEIGAKVKKLYPFGEEGLLKHQVQYAITAVSHFCLDVKDVMEKVREGRMMEYLFGYVIKTPYAQKLISSAESVHVEYDSRTGQTRPITLN